jgi:hypothetical protein
MSHQSRVIRQRNIKRCVMLRDICLCILSDGHVVQGTIHCVTPIHDIDFPSCFNGLFLRVFFHCFVYTWPPSYFLRLEATRSYSCSVSATSAFLNV